MPEPVVTNVDVTEQKPQREPGRLRQLESDLAHINRLSMVGGLAASLAHEIVQPISAASNNARAALNFIDRQPPDLGEIREALDCIVSDTGRAGSIIERIRDQIKRAPPQKQCFDIATAIDEVIALAQRSISENGISLQTPLAGAALPVEGDRVQVQQVILNLVLNAVEAMGSIQDGLRNLSFSIEKAQGVLVAVRDSGPGVDPRDRERIFQPFYTTKSSGLGIGLALCRSIIEDHGGRLWVDMNRPRGAVFRFTLPNPRAVHESASVPRTS